MQKRSEFILSLQESHSNYTATICLHSQPTITEKINKIREKDKKIIMNITSSGFVVNTVGFTWHHVALHIYVYILYCSCFLHKKILPQVLKKMYNKMYF